MTPKSEFGSRVKFFFWKFSLEMIEFILIRNPNEILRVKLSKLGFHFQNFIPYKKRPCLLCGNGNERREKVYLVECERSGPHLEIPSLFCSHSDFDFIQWKPTDTWPRDRCGRAQLVLLPSLADSLRLGADL